MTDLGEGLVFYHYKEPLKPVEGGFGFYGAVIVKEDGTGVQCHICGEVHSTLTVHVNKRHQISLSEYKEKFELSSETALVSERFRQAAIDRGREYWNSLSLKEKQEQIGRGKKILSIKRNKGTRVSLEAKNKRGTCPDQLLDKIKEVQDKIGHVPSRREFVDCLGTQRYMEPIFRVYGSWVNAVKMCGFIPKERQAAKRTHRYTREELIEYLQIFQQENNRPPSASDCRRGLLPYQEIYQYHFGSFQDARLAAGINEKPNGRWDTKTLSTTTA